MHIFTTRIILSIIALALTLGSGVWLSKIGRPLNVILFNIHKLISLAAIIFIVLGFIQILKPVQADSIISLLSVLGGICILLVVASGGMLSFDKFGIPLIVTIHKILAGLVILLGGLTLYFLSTAI